MAKKTAFRRLAKWLPLSAEFRDAVDKDDDVVIPERDVTPKAARAVPLDPFTQPPAIEEQAAVVDAVVETAAEPPAPIEDDPILLDLLDLIAEANTAADLTSYAAQCAEIANEANRMVAKRAVANKAKELELIWDKRLSAYTIAA